MTQMEIIQLSKCQKLKEKFLLMTKEKNSQTVVPGQVDKTQVNCQRVSQKLLNCLFYNHFYFFFSQKRQKEVS